MHHVVVQHGNLTSVRDVVLMNFLLTFCISNSFRSDDYVFHDFAMNMKISVFLSEF